MISVSQAQQSVLENSKTLGACKMVLSSALGYTLSIDIKAPINLPPFDSSAMDGYALRFGATNDQTTYSIVSEIKAGDGVEIVLKEGEASRIYTGAMVPATADAVIQQELTQVDYQTLVAAEGVDAGKNIRKQGEQIKQGEIALKKGTHLNAAGIGFLASLGIQEVEVFAKPRIGLIITGNELVRAGEILKPGQIFESNGLTLTSAITSTGFEASAYQMVKDTLEETIDCIRTSLENVDMLILSGGISVGDYDFVGTALKNLGVKECFYKVKQKPGKPLFFGKFKEKLCFALPGNPAAALSCYYNYILPAMRLQSGWTSPFLVQQTLKCSNSFVKRGDRSQFLKAKISSDQVEILEGQSSAMLHTFALANAFVYLDEKSGNVNIGDNIQVLKLP